MDSAAVKAREMQFFGYVNLKDTKAMDNWIDNFIAEDFINHTPIFDVPNDKEGLKEMFAVLFKLFPGIIFTIKEIIFEANILCFRHIVQGVKENEDVTGIAMVKFRNGKITDRWAFTEPI